LLFTSDIYAVSNPQALKTYFLYGHGENDPGNPSGEPENLGNRLFQTRRHLEGGMRQRLGPPFAAWHQ
jgi:hypothetical protein